MNYQLFAFQDGGTTKNPHQWKKIGVVKALTLPMACILTQLSPGNKYHFLVRATDVNGRQGECSEACTITLKYIILAIRETVLYSSLSALMVLTYKKLSVESSSQIYTPRIQRQSMIDNLYSTELGVFVNRNLIYVFFAVVIRRRS